MGKKTRIRITGVVQGVGFRPFVYNLAVRYGLKGFCLNDSEGVVIEVEGGPVEKFLEDIKTVPPPLSRIDCIKAESFDAGDAAKGFTIKESQNIEGAFALVSPDISVCHDCLNEMFDPSDSRYLYPFINCTNCGPRYSIILDIPYDRPKTTMAAFKMCPDCEREYLDPTDRRFHAQPTACPVCGPHAWISEKGTLAESDSGIDYTYAAVEKAQRLLKDGAVLAIKGLGGFHLACDALNNDAVQRLRTAKRKSFGGTGQSNKPFALMARDIAAVKNFADVSSDEKRELEGRIRPIVLLKKKPESKISDAAAPGNSRFGCMLPYTPLHHLLFHSDKVEFTALVMTSGNLSDEPIVTSNKEAVERLSGIADRFLLHNRDIYMRVDDSIVRFDLGRKRVFRRARGFVPEVVSIGKDSPDILACGAELKNTFCLTKGENAILSQHIGDLENLESLNFFNETLKNLKNTFRARPKAIALDMHPDYLSTKFGIEYIKKNNIPKKNIIRVQHHHAHVASCMAEHGLYEKCIGVAFDGTGYGPDGNIWGGEFFIADRKDFSRTAHLCYVMLPGGEAAIKEPWRMALSYLWHTYKDEIHKEAGFFLDRFDAKKTNIVLKMLDKKLNSPRTSSAGRLFDGVASIIGLKDIVTFEGEAAIELESIARKGAYEPYPFLLAQGSPSVIDIRPAIKGITADFTSGVDRSIISSRFHSTLAALITTAAKASRDSSGIEDVALSGGVFQNSLLIAMTADALKKAGFSPWFNELIPTNDGGISLGQAVVAIENLRIDE
ncbi:MAG: carbamoyltransferase HypF [Deltaproteobacteria bacterium]|nr:carbamoyltransferase HypF [Deltaproteobacteria bacterium]